MYLGNADSKALLSEASSSGSRWAASGVGLKASSPANSSASQAAFLSLDRRWFVYVSHGLWEAPGARNRSAQSWATAGYLSLALPGFSLFNRFTKRTSNEAPAAQAPGEATPADRHAATSYPKDSPSSYRSSGSRPPCIRARFDASFATASAFSSEPCGDVSTMLSNSRSKASRASGAAAIYKVSGPSSSLLRNMSIECFPAS
mmetsp:Transcript_10461/g.27696  ORF Transcript_10461/g.27696 Transcript_10461/m.27696 type:complete len:203 (+) Transcript_10461:2703-3311(+)